MAGTTFSHFSPVNIFPNSGGQNNLVLLSSGGGSSWGIVPIAAGGTGKSTAQTGLDALTTGNLNLSGLGARIIGDFSNAVISNRTMFTSKTVGATTQVGITPTGAVPVGQIASGILLEDNTSVAGTGSFCGIYNIQGGDMRFVSDIRGAGTYRPMSFYLNARPTAVLAIDANNAAHGVLSVIGGGDGGGASLSLSTSFGADYWVEASAYKPAGNNPYFRLGAGGTNTAMVQATGAYYDFASHSFRTAAGSNLLSIGINGQIGLGASYQYGTTGQFLMSGGPSASATWSSQLPQTLTATTQPVGTADNTLATTAYVVSATVNNALYLSGMAANTEVVANTIAQRTADGSLKASTFYGRATSANYADLAEKYTTDAEYPVGTVIIISSEPGAECTQSSAPFHYVHGIISEKPAYLMNCDAEGQAIALVGRVPVRVVGGVMKGQRLAPSTVPGCASASTINAFATALETNLGEGEQLVECAIVR